jgi:hypothetical protein
MKGLTMSNRILPRCVVALLALTTLLALPASAQPPAKPALSPVEELAALKADVESLKGKAASASVAMADVGFHWANLWFAAQAGNWPLANYYYSEARNHIRWLIRINPNPKGPDGNLVDLQGIFDGIDTSSLADVKKAIDKKDAKQFPAVYRTALESCYSCHKAVGRPYLKPQIPKTVPQPIINLDPAANWPQ